MWTLSPTVTYLRMACFIVWTAVLHFHSMTSSMGLFKLFHDFYSCPVIKMTCFWDCLHHKLPLDVQQSILQTNPYSAERLAGGIQRMVQNGTPVANDQTRWQGEPISPKMREEMRAWILEYKPSGVRSGHLTSICDPFFLFLCTTFNIRIEHSFLGKLILYTTTTTPTATVRVVSNRGHIQ